MPSGATLLRRIGRVAVTRRRAGLHRRQAAHAAVLFVELAADLHHLARRFRATGEDPAANHRVRQRQRLHDVAGLGDAAVGEDGDALLRAPPARQHRAPSVAECPRPATMRVVQIEPGPWPTLMALAPQSARNSTPAALVTLPAMMGSFGNASRSIRTVSPTPLLWPCAVETATTSTPRSTSPPTWVRMRSRSSSPNALRVARDRRAADQPEMRVARRLELRVPLLRDALDVAHREQAVQLVLVVHHQQLVDAGMLGEKLVGAGDGIAAQFLLIDACGPARAASAPRRLCAWRNAA